MIKVHGFPINVTMFPDKTSQVWKLSDDLLRADKGADQRLITWNFENEGELVHIIQLALLLDEVNGFKPITLDCPFLQYGRQDKETTNTSCFALEAFCRLFSGIAELRTFDAHNPSFFENKDICPFNFVNTLPYKEIEAIIDSEAIDLIVYPDKGASSRYPQLSAKYKWAAADKLRDQLTGEINGIKIDSVTMGSRILVVDDLCDGGRTFIELAKVLKEQYPAEMMLYVSHGIFSKGIDCLFHAGYSKVFTKNGQAFSDFKMDW